MAQVARPVLRSPARVEAPILPPTWPEPGRANRASAAAGGLPPTYRRSLGTSASVVGGAVVGAWLGYFLSQVVKSDWEGMRAGDRAAHRRRFAFSGAAVGAVGGYLVRPRPRRGAVPARPPTYVYVARSNRDYITRAELLRTEALTALEAVETLRPEWLEPSQAGSYTTPARDDPATALDTLVAVYVIDTRIGGLDVLSEISIPEIEELRVYDPEEAKRRWGWRHPRGAIEVVPAVRVMR